ncbi:MAG TPA: M23 family metallopeptidase, partial [Anaerolineales bacterium]|nr:M23 family metallopeptidase [Anaerolineales bacterium]
MNNKFLLRAVSLLILLALLTPVHQAGALAAPSLPPVDMFQLPWDQGLAWFAVDGFDNGSKRPASSSHNYKLGGAIDFAPRNTMFTGENTSNFWVTAAAAGIVVETSNCHLGIAHDGGWITQYLFLGNIQVNLGDAVARNQRLGIIADGVRYKYCTGYLEPNTPHLHFMLRPTMIGATFAGWQFNYNPLFNRTTFTKGLITVGLFKPLLNVPIVPPTPTPTPTTTAPTPTVTSTELTT